jgi:hypothetical protein
VALVHQQRGQPVDALATLERIIAFAPSLDWPRDDLAILLAGLGRKAEAEITARAGLTAQ